jgi:type II secretory pathway pseudopilin PulG
MTRAELQEKIKIYAPRIKAHLTLQNAGALVVIVVVIAVTVSTSRVMLRNYALQKQVNKLEKRVSIAQLETDKQRLLNQYLNTDAYLDIAARRQLTRGLPGEKLILVPSSVALTYVKPLPELEKPAEAIAKKSFVERTLDRLSHSE